MIGSSVRVEDLRCTDRSRPPVRNAARPGGSFLYCAARIDKEKAATVRFSFVEPFPRQPGRTRRESTHSDLDDGSRNGVPAHGPRPNCSDSHMQRRTMKPLILAIVLALLLSATTRAAESPPPIQTGDKRLVTEVSWSPDNALVLTASFREDSVRVWEVATGRVLWRVNTGLLEDDRGPTGIQSSAWSADGRYVATGTWNGTLQLWESSSGRLVWNVRAHANSVTAIAISPDASVIATASSFVDQDSAFRLWSVADGTLIRDMSKSLEDTQSVVFLNASRFRAGSSDGRVSEWSTRGRRVGAVRTLECCGARAGNRLTFTYSPRLTYAYASQGDSLVVFRTSSGRSILRLRDPWKNFTPTASGDETLLFVSNGDETSIYNSVGKRVETIPELARGVLNSDGRLLAVFQDYREDGVKIYDTRSGERRHWLVGHPGAIRGLAFSPDGRLFASGGEDKIVRIWDTETRRVIHSLKGHTEAVWGITFNESGDEMASRSDHEWLHWNVKTGSLQDHVGSPLDVNERDASSVVSPSGRLTLINDRDKPLRLAHAASGETIRDFGVVDQLDVMSFCPDEKRFLVKPRWSGWQLWSVAEGGPTREFDVGFSYGNVVAFHPDGRTFITGGSGQNIFMFDLETGNTLWSLFPVDRDEFEIQKAREAVRVESLRKQAELTKLADDEIGRNKYAAQVSLRFDGFGGDRYPRERKQRSLALPSRNRTPYTFESRFVWIRLRNDSPLPIEVPTLELPGKPGRERFPTLRDGARVVLSTVLLESTGAVVPDEGYGFLRESILLPGHSVLFGVHREYFKDGRGIRTYFLFRKSKDGGALERYGSPLDLQFHWADIPDGR